MSWVEEQIAKLNDADRARFERIRDAIAGLGDDDAEGWALSEVTEDIPQFARYLALRRLWPEVIDRWAGPGVPEGTPAGRRLLAAGVDREELVRFARTVAQETTFDLLYRFTGEGGDPDAPDDAPGWALMETDGDGTLTGRTIDGLYQDLLSMDPSGREADDLLFDRTDQ